MPDPAPSSHPSARSRPPAPPGRAGDSRGDQETLTPPGPPVLPGTSAQMSGAPAELVDHPKFEILRLLGQGGMGAVYKARHKVMNRVVALKVISAKLVDNPKAVERFHREVQAAARLDHPNIVRAHDADQAGATHFLVMEFVEGTDLARYVEQKGPLPVLPACHFIRQAALGLQHAHEHGMVHRDIKPHNLMLASGGCQAPDRDNRGVNSPRSPTIVKVMDFGLARLARADVPASGLTGENVLMGTADYIAPEQAKDAHTADIRADIYSLGCTLYHLLAGQPPFGGTAVQKIANHLTGIVPVAQLPAAVPAELRAVLAKMTAREPAARYQAPDEVAQALVPFIKKVTGAKPPPLPVAPPPARERDAATAADRTVPLREHREPKRARRLPAPPVIGGAALLALLLIGIVVKLASRERQPPVVEHANPPAPGVTSSPIEQQPGKLPATFQDSRGMEFVLVPKGKSWLGGGEGKPGDKEVEIKEDFYLGKYEVTQEEWGKVMGTRPSNFGRTGNGAQAVKDISDEQLRRFPVESVSWDDAQLFLQNLNKQDNQDGWVYRLPWEVEWEYACRGGPTNNKLDSAFDFYFEKPVKQLRPEWANSPSSFLARTCQVGSYKPNKLNLYDMHGNVFEWCNDEQKEADGGSHRVFRGGSWFVDSGGSQASLRRACLPHIRDITIGLRVARVPAGKEIVAPSEKKTETRPAAFKNSLGMEFVLVPKGKSWLGGGEGIAGEKQVEVLHDFYLGKYEVTQEEWQKLMGGNPSHFARAGKGNEAVKDTPDTDLKRFPVEDVSWHDVRIFLDRLNKEANVTGWTYRLPKADEWEYACRGGPLADRAEAAFDFYIDKPSNQLLPGQANFDPEPGKGLQRPCKVGSYKPNRLGLYDMHANVAEWCQDGEGFNSYFFLGSSWNNEAKTSRAAARNGYNAGFKSRMLGFRVARVPIGKVLIGPAAPVTTAPAADAAAARAIAEWAIKLGATVEVQDPPGGASRRVKTLGDLPEGEVVLHTILFFDGGKVTDAELVRLRGFARLSYLTIDKSKLTDRGLESLRDLPNLTTLFLGNNPKITDAGLEHLKTLPKLRLLALTNTGVSDEGIKALRRAMPHCTIQR